VLEKESLLGFWGKLCYPQGKGQSQGTEKVEMGKAGRCAARKDPPVWKNEARRSVYARTPEAANPPASRSRTLLESRGLIPTSAVVMQGDGRKAGIKKKKDLGAAGATLFEEKEVRNVK